MTTEEAVRDCEFWTTNVAETRAFGSSTNEQIAGFFNATVSLPRQQWTDPTGPRHYEIRVPRWLSDRDEKGDLVTHENDAYVQIVAEIERRKANV